MRRVSVTRPLQANVARPQPVTLRSLSMVPTTTVRSSTTSMIARQRLPTTNTMMLTPVRRMGGQKGYIPVCSFTSVLSAVVCGVCLINAMI
jgi:hypothetical protein